MIRAAQLLSWFCQHFFGESALLLLLRRCGCHKRGAAAQRFAD